MPNHASALRFDCVIVGAGPAGLTALTYLTRFRRNVVALGGGGPRPRCQLIERTYNLPGYPGGINGEKLLARMREQAAEFGGEVWEETATQISGVNRNFEVALSDGRIILASKIVLAMGVHDRTPEISGIAEHEGLFVRYCPVCDGFEHIDKRLGIIGSGGSAVRHALFLRTFSRSVTLFLHGCSVADLGRHREQLEQNGIEYFEPEIAKFMIDDSPGREYKGAGVVLSDGTEHGLDVLYSALGCDLHLEPVVKLGLKLDEDGYIVTDLNQETSIAGMYAAGDLTSQINQISIAFGQAAVAATRIHGSLDQR